MFKTLIILDPYTLIFLNIAIALTISKNRANYNYKDNNKDDYKDNKEA